MESIISAIIQFISAIINGSSNRATNERQMEHDKEMAQINLENQQKLMDYQNNLQQETNTIANQKGHMMAAGYSPALMYASPTQAASVSGGSASGSSSSLNPLQLFNRIPVDSVVQTMFQRRSQQFQRDRLLSDVALNEQKSNYYAMQTAKEAYDVGLRKRMERTIIDKSLADVEMQKAYAENLRFITHRGAQLLPGELAQQNVITQEMAKRIEKMDSDIRLNAFQMADIRSNINRVSKMSELTDSQIRQVDESVRTSALSRVMQEFGLTQRITPPQLRSASELHNALNNDQMKGAFIELRNLGFSEHEAANSVVWYCATDPKDVTPSVINAAARIFSTAIKK